MSRARAASVHLSDCRLCPHLCGEERARARGKCRVGQDSYIASEMLHRGEEELLNPAHAIFLSGCTAVCSFCTAARFAFRPRYGVSVPPAHLAQRILERQAEGARSVCFIGGDPTPHIPFILETLSQLEGRLRIPTVFNSNFYLTDEALTLLDGAIDIYLPDLKFGPGDCGDRIGGMPSYWHTVTGAIRSLSHRKARLLVRHLIMPGHFECCTEPALTWLASLPDLRVSLLDQYLPAPGASGELARLPSSDEIHRSFALAHTLNLSLA